MKNIKTSKGRKVDERIIIWKKKEKKMKKGIAQVKEGEEVVNRT